MTPIRGGLPSTATVSCEIRSAGGSRGTFLGPTSGTGLIVDADSVNYPGGPGEDLELCSLVTDEFGTSTTCVPITVATIDPLASVDSTVCSVLLALRPVVNGLNLPGTYIDDDGDLFVLGNWVYDCPPRGS